MASTAALARQRAIGRAVENRRSTFIELVLVNAKDSFVRAAPQVLLLVFENTVNDVSRQIVAIGELNELFAA